MRKRATSGQARLLAAVSELDASQAPAMDAAARRLAGVIGALVPADLASVNLGDPRPFHDVAFECGEWPIDPRHNVSLACGVWRPLEARDLARMRFTETGLVISDRRSDAGSLRSLPPTIDYGRYWRPLGIENVVGAPLDFPNGCAWLATHRAAGDFSDEDVRLLDQLRPVASRLLRRASVSSLAEASASAWGLAPREAEVFAFAVVGLSLPSIASILGLSVGTVRTQLGRAYAKTAVRSRAAATSALLDVVGPTALQDAGRGLVPGHKGPLTGREVMVLRIAATGRTTSAIASAIGISTETTKTHLANAYRKLGVQNRSQALLLVGTAMVSVSGSDRPVVRS